MGGNTPGIGVSIAVNSLGGSKIGFHWYSNYSGLYNLRNTL